jgi:hypothetical protein
MQLTSDLDNLLASVQFPIVMVDGPLTVRRATPAAGDAFNILPTDIGRRHYRTQTQRRYPPIWKIFCAT